MGLGAGGNVLAALWVATAGAPRLPPPGALDSHAAYAEQVQVACDQSIHSSLARFDAHLAKHPDDAPSSNPAKNSAAS